LKDKVIVIGLGYVGLPLAIAAAKSGYNVVGIDLNTEKVSNINKGISPIEDIDNAQIQELLSSNKFIASNEYREIRDAEIVIICVPTPLLKNQLPDLSNVENAAMSISKNLTKNLLVR
jgi:UDP-N-acetyl-D-glucosamine dehydrogenase